MPDFIPADPKNADMAFGAFLATNHYPNLLAAINMSLDVPFLLTGGQDPTLTGYTPSRGATATRPAT